jgi:hypothetical protein
MSKLHVKVRVKVTLGPEKKWRFGSTLSLTSALDEGGWSTPHTGRFTPPEREELPMVQRLGGPQTRSAGVRKISAPPGFCDYLKEVRGYCKLKEKALGRTVRRTGSRRFYEPVIRQTNG